MRSRTRRVAAVFGGVILAASLSACAPTALVEALTNPQSEIEYNVEIENAALQTAKDEVLNYFNVDDWVPPTTGNVRTSCSTESGEKAYLFYGSWFTTEAAALSGDGEVARQAIADFRVWLEAEGWSYIEEFDFTADDLTQVNAFGVTGTKLGSGINMMQAIYYYEGDDGIDYPHIVVDIDSTCLASEVSV